VEGFIWIVVVSQIVKNAHSMTAYIGNAAGFAVETYIGMLIEERMSMGTLVLRIIPAQGGGELAQHLRSAGYGVTMVSGEGASGAVNCSIPSSNAKTLTWLWKLSGRNAPRHFTQSRKFALPRVVFFQ
jgi:uncharacterized protein YebE (UPF0316 family)